MKTSHSIRILLIALLAVGLACGCFLQPKIKPIEPSAPVSPDGKYLTDSAKYWLKKVEEFGQDNNTHAPGGIVLLGDSITARFPVKESFPDPRDGEAGLHVINRGIGGDKIGGWKYYGVIDRLDVSVYDLKPRKLFILIGINDILSAKTPPREMKRGYRNLLAALKKNCPNCEIYVQSILPVRGKHASHNPEILALNKYIKRVTKKHGFTHLDIHSQFTDEKGELIPAFTNDDLHLTPAGYQHWQQILLPLMSK